jgi:hypothetical protein
MPRTTVPGHYPTIGAILDPLKFLLDTTFQLDPDPAILMADWGLSLNRGFLILKTYLNAFDSSVMLLDHFSRYQDYDSINLNVKTSVLIS